ncbi:MAG: hypothetical protein OEZ09_17505, partial [Betaproteobacteria bacterium]|nr:hypothetical protein [Betaproteobacteria bacterium]
DQLYLFEERPSEEWSRETHFGECEDIVGFDDVVEDLMDDYRNTVDQDFTARSRLFDMFLGDWDRHDDQWRWAKCDRKDGKGKIYRPIPRDRDQAFAKYDGALLSLAKLFTPTIRKLNVFSEDIGNLKWFNDNGKIFDRDFINRLTRERWIAISEELKSSLTDAVIEESIRQLSPDVFAKDGTELIATLKARRDQLPEFAAQYYDILAKTVTIRATRNADFIEIIENPGQVDIRVYDSNKAGEKNEVYYSRTFYKGETREIQIYGLAGHDRVDVRGAGSGGIKVFFIGGEDGDRVEVSETGRHGNLKFQDTETREEVMPDAQLTYHQVGDDKNTYER